MSRVAWPLLWLLIVLLSACASSEIIETNPRLVAAGEPHAQVYFLRPPDQRTRGVADDPISVELGHKKLLELGLGEYVLVHLSPGPADVVLRNKTYMTNNPNPVEVWRSRRYEFKAGGTYFIVADEDREEFRGIYFVPREVDAQKARALGERLKPVGKLARQAPLG